MQLDSCYNAKFQEISQKGELPGGIRKLLRDVSERGGEFRDTDVGNGPNSRFVIGALSENCTLVAVEHGGFGYSVLLHIYLRDGGAWADVGTLHDIFFPTSFSLFIADSQFVIGKMNLENAAPATPTNQAIKWYELSAESHFPPAEFALGEMYLNGHGIQKNTDVAEKWFARAIEHAPLKFAFDVGQIYEKGVVLPRNDAKAVSLYRLAAEKGNELAQQRLGEAYDDGELGLGRNDAEALYWYRLAAAHPVNSVKVRLGAMYWEGRGVKANHIVALALLGLPATSHEAGDAKRMFYEKSMTSDELKVAHALCEQLYKDMFWNGPENNLILGLDRYLAEPKMPKPVTEKDRDCQFDIAQ